MGGDTLKNISTDSEGLLHQVFDQSSAGFQIIDRDWKYIFVNPSVVKQGKSSESELLGHTMMEAYPGIENTNLFVQLKKCMDDKAVVRMDNHFIYPDGTKGWFRLFIHPWSDGIMIFSFDITQHKYDEMELNYKIEELEELVGTDELKQKVAEIKKMFLDIHKPETTILNQN